MESFLQWIILAVSLACLPIFVLIAVKLSMLAKIARNSEKILQRILELTMASSNEEKARRYSSIEQRR